MSYTVEVWKSKTVWQWWRERYFWIVRHENGNILLTSEMYHNRKDCIDIAQRFARQTKCEYEAVNS